METSADRGYPRGMRCPCGSSQDFNACCGPILAGESRAATAQALMRSRYVAYTRGDVSYIERTLAPESRAAFDERATRDWAREARWLGLEILSTEHGGTDDDLGHVEFIATYEQRGERMAHRERSRFRRDKALGWLFVAGEARAEKQSAAPVKVERIGRNDPCPCGSGKKYKKCCGA